MSKQRKGNPEPAGAEEEAIFLDLRRVIADADPVPAEVIEAAVATWAWRRVDAELAELAYDSLVDGELVRHGRGGRQLTFEGPGLTVEVEVGSVSLHGQIVPPQAAVVEVRHRGPSVTVTADRLGHFWVEEMPRGPVSLRCLLDPGGEPVVTSWVVI